MKRKLFLKIGVSRENFSSKWVLPDKTYPQNGSCKRKLFLKMGASIENFSSKWVHSQKTFAVNLMHQDKTLLQNGCIKSPSFMKFRKRIILFLKVSLHVIKVSLLMWFSLSLITSQSKLSLNKRRRSVKGSLSCCGMVFLPLARSSVRKAVHHCTERTEAG